jgi:hypothetical protein
VLPPRGRIKLVVGVPQAQSFEHTLGRLIVRMMTRDQTEDAHYLKCVLHD